jgi:HK97 gp10 family phage protein
MVKIGYGHDISRTVSRFERRVIREIKRIVAETAEKIAAQARALAPVDLGNLRASIEVNYYKGGLAAEVRVTADYAIYVEYGVGIYAENGNGRKDGWAYFNERYGRWVFTRGFPPQPYWRPALEFGRKHFNSELRKLG